MIWYFYDIVYYHRNFQKELFPKVLMILSNTHKNSFMKSFYFNYTESWIYFIIYWELISLGVWQLKYWSFSELCSSTVCFPQINTNSYRSGSGVWIVPLQPGDDEKRSKTISLKQCATNSDFLRCRQQFDGVETAASASKRSVIWNLEGSQTGKWSVPAPKPFNCPNFICDSTHAPFQRCLF